MKETTAFVGLRCTQCYRDLPVEKTVSMCPLCNGLVDTVFDLATLQEHSRKELDSVSSMWRFKPFLPVRVGTKIVSAGEGSTPLRGLESQPGKVWVKDETRNPTGTFKDRGASLAVSVLSSLGVRRLVLASEGNAGCSFVLYAGMAGLACHVFLPRQVNQAKADLSVRLRAKVSKVKGTISDAGKAAGQEASRTGAYNASTFVTPFRHDGKGTLALEICEALEWNCPDWVVYPVGGGVGLIGMWKFFKTLEVIGWTDQTPRFVAVQPRGCSPVVKAYNSGKGEVEEWVAPRTVALGLKIPKPLAGRWILSTLRESNSIARTITDQEILHAMKQLGRKEGLLIEPSSASDFAALPALYDEKIVDKSETVVAIATGSGLKTIENL